MKDAADRARVHKILLALKQDPANGIREVWTAADLPQRGAHPDAAFGLDVVDGFYTGSGHDVLVKPSTTKGGHGFGPDRTALHSSFILTGPTRAAPRQYRRHPHDADRADAGADSRRRPFTRSRAARHDCERY